MMKNYLQCVLLVVLSIATTSINGFAQKQKPKGEELLGVKDAQGRDFWIAIPANELAQFPVNELEIYIASETDAEVVIYDPAAQREITRNIQAGDVLTLSSLKQETSWTWEVREAEVPILKGIHITSDEPVVVYVLNSKTTSSDGYLAIPTRVWGTDYIHCSYYDFREFSEWAGGFIVIAREDGTTIDVDLRGVGANDGKTSGGKTINTGTHYNVTLNEGEVYMVKGDAKTRGVFDISGSRITSNKPIGLISFHERTTMPNLLVNGNGRNNLCEMLPPVSAWGQRYATVEFARENLNGIGKGDVFRVVASEPNTQWTLKYYNKTTKQLLGQDGGVLANAGDFADLKQSTSPTILVNGYSVWEADKPVLLMQYSCSQTFDGDLILDPFMIYIAPLEQFSTNSIFQSPTAKKFGKHRLNLIVWADSADPNYVDNLKSLEINGAPIWSHPNSLTPTLLFNRMPNSNLHWCTLDFGTTGKSYQILSNDKIRCAGYLYGFGAADAYGWPVGAQYRDLSSVDTTGPEVSSEDLCGAFNVRATELRNIPAVPRAKPLRTDQVETGISDIEFDPGYTNQNFRIALETSQILGEVAFKDFRFRVEVIDPSKDASARVRVRDFGFTEKLGPSNATYQLFTYTAPKMGRWEPKISYGKHRVGAKVTREVPIVSTPTAPLTVNSVRLANGTQFKLAGAAHTFPLTIAPGDSISVTLEYAATRDSTTIPAGQDIDTLFVGIGCGEVSAVLSAFAVEPKIAVSNLHIGSLTAGVKLCSPLYIANPGSDDLVISDITGFEGSNFSLTSPLSPPFPIRILPGAGVNLSSVCYQADNIAEESVSVTFSSNAALGDSVSVWTANGITGVEDVDARTMIVVSPQPVQDVLNVRFQAGSPSVLRMSIFDVQGLLAGEWEMAEPSEFFSARVSDLVSGSYTLVVTFVDGSCAVPVLISR